MASTRILPVPDRTKIPRRAMCHGAGSSRAPPLVSAAVLDAERTVRGAVGEAL